MTTAPSEDSSDIELLDCIDDALRNGSNMTRANLAFDYLLERIGFTRMDIPGYAKEQEDFGSTVPPWMEAFR